MLSCMHALCPQALLLGDQADMEVRGADRELDCIATRLSTALATLNEFPSIRWEARGHRDGMLYGYIC